MLWRELTTKIKVGREKRRKESLRSARDPDAELPCFVITNWDNMRSLG
jgi:hypothetical protein